MAFSYHMLPFFCFLKEKTPHNGGNKFEITSKQISTSPAQLHRAVPFSPLLKK